MYDLLSVGTTTIDLTFELGQMETFQNKLMLSSGGKYFAEKFSENLGGGATNVAIGCAKLQCRVALMTEIGDNPFKRVIYEKLDVHGIDRTQCVLSPLYQNFSSVLLMGDGEKTAVNYQSPSRELLKSPVPQALLRRCRAVFLASVPSVSLTRRIELLRGAKDAGCITVVNLGSRDCARPHRGVEELLKYADILILNAHELAMLLRAHYQHISWHDLNLNHLSQLTLPPVVIVTDGARGSHGYWSGTHHHESAIKPRKVVDTTGAGDGYTAGFIANFIQSGRVQEAMREGAHYAACKIEHHGAN